MIRRSGERSSSSFSKSEMEAIEDEDDGGSVLDLDGYPEVMLWIIGAFPRDGLLVTQE